MEEIEVPTHFLCPISMQLMRDPVIVSTGITYERESIERWLFSFKKINCPVTKQVLRNTELTPNHTLRRLIQSWCTLNSCHGVDRIPTPKQPVNKSQILKLINEAKKFPHTQLKCLTRIRSIAHQSDSNKTCLEASGTVEFLVSIVKKVESEGLEKQYWDEALSILHYLDASDIILIRKLGNEDGKFFNALFRVLKVGNHHSRAYAIMLLRSIFSMADPVQLLGVKTEFFIEIVNILKDNNISERASKATIKILVDLLPWGSNRIKVAEVGVVSVLIELLIEKSDRRVCELIQVALYQLCRCAEGRAGLLEHGAGLAIVSKKILRVSHVATNRAVRILSLISRFCSSSRVLQEMLHVGVVSKLCLVLQVDSSWKTKEKVKEMLRLHSRVWKDASCIPPNLFSSYPSS